jgi:hypothetical protein
MVWYGRYGMGRLLLAPYHFMGYNFLVWYGQIIAMGCWPLLFYRQLPLRIRKRWVQNEVRPWLSQTKAGGRARAPARTPTMHNSEMQDPDDL